ncbi:MAG: O-antigen ligase family protein [Hyphomicrobiaceae bacterium]|nr:O-antigen ligase family protein [Hyphomicrobiaceae bacterium]
MAGAIALGGGTRAGFLSDVVLQLLAIPLLLTALWSLSAEGSARAPRGALLFCLALTAVPLAQLVPMPPPLWSALPGREIVTDSLSLAGQPLPWRPISMAPHATWLSLASLVVPLAIFLAAVQLPRRARRTVSLVLLGAGAVSVFLGLLQVAQGPQSPLRFFAFTNPSEAVGFFANRNHFAALLYSLTLLAAAWTVHAGTLAAAQSTRRRHDDGPLILALIAGLAVMLALVAAQMMARSRAGLGLAIVALIGVFALALRDRPGQGRLTPGRLLAGAVGVALVFGVQFALYRVLDRFTADPLSDARIPFARTTFEAAMAHMPLGSGMGTFVPVYALFEKPQDALTVFANRAHNDVLEVWLEAGIPALLLTTLFCGWLVARGVALWRARPQPGGEIDLLLARAAVLVLALIGAHSLVDYPLRTGAMMAVFAFAAALAFEPQDAPEPRRTRGRHAEMRAAVPQAAPAPMPDWPRQPPERRQQGGGDWSDMDWPEAWRSSKPPKPPQRN